MIRPRIVAPSLSSVAQRLRSSDMLQVLGLFLGAQLFVVAIRWPGAGASNEVWFTLAQTRVTLLALAALGYGAAEFARPRAAQRVTAAALVMFVALSAPFDAATYAASYPAVPFWWSATLPFAETLAYFGIGLVLGRVTAWARLGALLPLFVPALLVAGIWLDVRLGTNVLNPLTGPLHVAPLHGACMAVLTVVTLGVLLRGKHEEVDESDDGSATP